MTNALLLSAAYGWFIGLLVLMAVMAVLFVVIAVFAARPFKVGEGVDESYSALKLLEAREAELTAELLNKRDDAATTEKLREVGAAKKLVKELLEQENGVAQEVALGIDSSLTADEAASLESEEKVAIEQTFGAAADGDGLKKSFSAQLIQSSDDVKVWYFELKNCILCYEKTKVRMHWNNEKFYIGRNNVASLTLRGKQLCLYLALNADDYSDNFPVKSSTSEVYRETTPCLFRIRNTKSVQKAKELISLMMADYGVMYVRTNHSIYALPYEDNDALVARGLARPSGDRK